ncbi:MAG: hypothetical protein V9F00_10690 [Nocardioides sp.]
MRRVFAYVLGLPFALVGEITAHQGAYLLVDGSHASAHLSATGHGYLEGMPSFVVALLLVLAAAALLDGLLLACGRSARQLPLRTFLVIGPTAFAVQEIVERWAATGHVPWLAWAEPTFLLGLLLQLPTAWIAFHLARLIVQPVRRLAERILSTRRRPTARRAPAPTPGFARQLVFVSSLATRCVRGRAPPQAC